MVEGYLQKGWVKFPLDPVLARWVRHALPVARAAVSDPKHSEWHDCEGTWFIGVDAMENDGEGRVNGSPPLAGQAVEFINRHLGAQVLHKGQISVIYPGYPQPRRGEGEAAFRYRARRDAAHVDGLRPSGPERRRRVEEPHAWILGIPLSEASPDAAPLVLWEGSHHRLGRAFADAFSAHPAEAHATLDITDAYQATRREVFESCPRIELHGCPGEAYLLHRHLLHGVAPWAANATADRDGRMIAYFRPEFPEGLARWLQSD
ncbi:hypothetical protein Q5Y75_05565 [Ruegeria sp. 2205SS24-7]|uniref:hypothetical protein n=1 Tax=Ruegeria discodermiae TaxID=3064389 RepID=UPI00274161E0|nr:hypothetical protein [Ruegeria sp. 2205SS24-7]MDP5216678.1 hypothetical protein [Ruegeria sp. 2205SS24-7]